MASYSAPRSLATLTIPNVVLYDERLSLREKCVVSALIAFGEVTFKTYAEISSALGENERTIRRTIKSLESLQWITSIRTKRPDGKLGRKRYMVTPPAKMASQPAAKLATSPAAKMATQFLSEKNTDLRGEDKRTPGVPADAESPPPIMPTAHKERGPMWALARDWFDTFREVRGFPSTENWGMVQKLLSRVVRIHGEPKTRAMLARYWDWHEAHTKGEHGNIRKFSAAVDTLYTLCKKEGHGLWRD